MSPLIHVLLRDQTNALLGQVWQQRLLAIRTNPAPPALWLVQLDKRRSAKRKAAGSHPGRTNTQGLYSK